MRYVISKQEHVPELRILITFVGKGHIGLHHDL